jgi:hypothetical protein
MPSFRDNHHVADVEGTTRTEHLLHDVGSSMTI